MQTMNTVAQSIGEYLQTIIRDTPGLSAAEVARRAGLSTNYIGRLRAGDTEDPSVQNIVGLVHAADGDVRDLIYLIRKDITIEKARNLALEYLRRRKRASNDLTPDEQDELRMLSAEERRSLLQLVRVVRGKIQSLEGAQGSS